MKRSIYENILISGSVGVVINKTAIYKQFHAFKALNGSLYAILNIFVSLIN